MRHAHLIISGHVQGVGYRAWCARQAQALGLHGWVRNRANGTVEAVLAGPATGVEQMVAACRSGPPGARVDDLLVHEPCETALAVSGEDTRFRVIETL